MPKPYRPQNGDEVFTLWSGGHPLTQVLQAWNPVTHEELGYEAEQWVMFPDRASAIQHKELHPELGEHQIQKHIYKVTKATPEYSGSIQ